MALTNNFSFARIDWGSVTGTPLTRGLVLNGQQVEMVRVTKLTGDTTATVTLTDVQRPSVVYIIPILDSAGAAITAKAAPTIATFTKPNYTDISLTSLGNWVGAFIFAVGRSYKTS